MRREERRSASAAAPSTNAYAGLDFGLRPPPRRAPATIESRDVNASVRQRQRVNPRNLARCVTWPGDRAQATAQGTSQGEANRAATGEDLKRDPAGERASASHRPTAAIVARTRSCLWREPSAQRWASVPLAEHGEPERSAGESCWACRGLAEAERAALGERAVSRARGAGAQRRRIVLGVPWPGGSRTRSAGRACR
jgi:hypothetical protein